MQGKPKTVKPDGNLANDGLDAGSQGNDLAAINLATGDNNICALLCQLSGDGLSIGYAAAGQ